LRIELTRLSTESRSAYHGDIMKKTILLLGLTMALSTGSAMALPAAVSTPMQPPSDIQQVQFLLSGRNYCWYDNGWNGPGFYWCGYALRRGSGWGGGAGWHGWSHGGVHGRPGGHPHIGGHPGGGHGGHGGGGHGGHGGGHGGGHH